MECIRISLHIEILYIFDIYDYILGMISSFQLKEVLFFCSHIAAFY